MNILMVPSWYPSLESPENGVFFRDQARALRRAGHTVGVLCVPPSLLSLKNLVSVQPALWPRGINEFDDDGIVTLRFEGWKWLPGVLGGARVLESRAIECMYRRYVKRCSRPMLVHAQSAIMGGYYASVLSHRHDLPLVITEHRSAFLANSLSVHDEIVARQAFSGATKVVCVSPCLADAVSRYVGGKRVEVVPNLLDTDCFQPVDPDSGRRDSLFVLLCVALLRKEKAIDGLVRAFYDQFAEDDKVELWIVGDGPERPRLQALCVKLGISSRIRFLGKMSRDQLPQVYGRCSVFVLPSRFETFGVVLIEALCCGKPVIATRSGGPEAIVTEKNGLLVPVDDAPALGRAMHRMYEQCRSYSARDIRQDCVDRFSYNAVVRQIEQVYKEAIDTYQRVH